MGSAKGILSFTDTFPNEESYIKYFENLRWKNGVVSPFDKTSKVYKCKNNKYRCKNIGKYFDVKTGTVFANTKLPLRFWFYAMFLFLSHKRGVSSCQLARDLGITQKTAWNMLNKVRSYMNILNDGKLNGDVEIDETFVGGKNKNRHKDKKVEKCQGRSFKDKVPVFGILQRGGNMIAKVVTNTQAKTLAPYISDYVNENSVIYTDGWDYGGFDKYYVQRSVDHGIGFYGTSFLTDDGEFIQVSTNGIEDAWSHLKRTIFGTYYHVNKKHMQKYVDEFVFRFNTKYHSDNQRFDLYLRHIA